MRNQIKDDAAHLLQDAYHYALSVFGTRGDGLPQAEFDAPETLAGKRENLALALDQLMLALCVLGQSDRSARALKVSRVRTHAQANALGKVLFSHVCILALEHGLNAYTGEVVGTLSNAETVEPMRKYHTGVLPT